MARKNAGALGREPIGKLLIDQAVPASVGILVMSLNILVDTIFVGNWIDWNILKETSSLGFVTLSRQAVVSITYLLMNNILFDLGGEDSVTVYAIIGRMLMFALFPVLGMTQGFLPIAGYNYGAENWQRVRKSINTAIFYATGLGVLVFAGIMIFSEEIVSIFTTNPVIVSETPVAMRWVFAATPIIALQLIGSAYFQAIGKAVRRCSLP